ncbi:glycosyl hydrolases family 18-domain-containing protein [Collybia nuda]|uniref:Glycosyl hydrolases family 18-domain-containing protein n=1 Tax=Collybia nuda TaxID=64659 RepID=A0A9P5XTC0_9AGAR|nr:glycosyl hydrolases family 18-domain-containing protein [Collybia nuda]
MHRRRIRFCTLSKHQNSGNYFHYTLSQLPENINPHLYTHINYAFVFMAENNSVVPHEHNDEELSLRMNKWIHRINPSCTTSVSVGGWSMNDGPSKYTGGVDYTPFFSKMAETAASRSIFIQSAIKFARRLEFDGVDIDWEFIGDPTRGGKSADRANFSALVREMRAAMQAEASSSGKKELMITMAAPAGPDDFKNIDAKTISDYVDWINIMTYDFYGNWENQVENHAPIADTRIPGWSFTSAIDQYLGAGVPPAKLMAGLPLYGRVWTLSDLSNTSPGAPGTAGTAGRCTAEHGYMSYFEIKEVSDAQEGKGVTFEPQDGWQTMPLVTPFVQVFDNQWVGYDDDVSFSAKVGIINDRGLGGAMLWAVDLDTSDAALTRKLLDLYRACPKDGAWPTTSTDEDSIIDCPADSNKPGNTQIRHCNGDGTWGSVDAKGCTSFVVHSLAAQQCIG